MRSKKSLDHMRSENTHEATTFHARYTTNSVGQNSRTDQDMRAADSIDYLLGSDPLSLIQKHIVVNFRKISLRITWKRGELCYVSDTAGRPSTPGTDEHRGCTRGSRRMCRSRARRREQERRGG